MKPELRGIHSPDVEDLSVFALRAGDSFGVLVQLMIGPHGGEGEESFEVVVCSPQWLESQSERHPVLSLEHYVMMRTYDRSVLVDYIQRRLERIEGGSWQEVAGQVARFAKWEFEDYNDRDSR